MEQYNKDIFKEAVYDIVRLIPYGRATSYKAIAVAIGFPNMSRMVGNAMRSATVADLPAHRVVNNQGELTGRGSFQTPQLMQQLLEEEGVEVENNRIKNWKKVFWDPLYEL